MVSSSSGGISKQIEGGGQLLQELEALSHALYRGGRPAAPAWNDPAAARERRASEYQHRQPAVAVGRSRPSISAVRLDGPEKQQQQKQGYEKQLHEVTSFSEWLQENASSERKSLWNWKPLRALAHIGQQRFHCAFLAQVHAIKNLPSSMNGLRLVVHFRHKDSYAQTMPCRVSQGSVEFDETLRIRCTVYGSKKASQGIKYMPKSFVLSVVSLDVDELELGKHQLDLSRMLPESFDEEGNGEKDLNRTTSFYLSGKAKGGTLMVTFGYEILDKEFSHPADGGDGSEYGESPIKRGLQSFNSLPNSPPIRPVAPPTYTHHSSSSFTEPGVDMGDYLSMEHLSLDDGEERSYTLKSNHRPRSLSQSDIGFIDFSMFDPINKRIPRVGAMQLGNFGLQDTGSGQRQSSEVDQTPEDDLDFDVVDQGVEISTFSVNAPMRLPPTAEDAEDEFETRQQVDVGMAGGKPVSLYFPSTNESDDRGKNMVTEEQAMAWELNNKDAEMPSIPTENLLERKKKANAWNDDSMERVLGAFKESNEEKSRDWVDDDNSKAFSAAGLKVGEEGAGSNLDHEADLVTGEFLHMLEEGQESAQHSSDSEPSSPRALLLKQFKQEALLEGGLGRDLASPRASDFELEDDHQKYQSAIGVGNLFLPEKRTKGEDKYAASWGSEEESGLAAIMDAAETELQKAAQKMRSKARAKMLEDAETEELMHQWGLDEKAFQSTSLPENKRGLNSSTSISPAPPLAQGFDAVIPTRDGGALRSMSSAHFQRGQFDGRLVMHVSKPVVVPAEMGYSALDILKGMAAAGMEQMAAEAMHAMPLDDITGKSVQQIAVEGRAALESPGHRYRALGTAEKRGLDSQTTYVHNLSAEYTSTDLYANNTEGVSGGFERKSQARARSSIDPFEEYMSLEELAPVAMGKIEALAMEGLKVQCDMAEEDAPYNVDALSWKDMVAFKDQKISRGSGIGSIEGVASMHLLEGTESGQEDSQSSSGLMSMAISLEEWMRLDAGVYDQSENNEKTLAILAAHHATHNEIVPRRKRDGDKTQANEHQRKGGIMNDTLTLAMLVQLRDPLRNYEPVGSPMMALVQAERIVVPPRPKMWKRVSVKGNGEDEEDVKRQEAQTPQFKITGVHMSGLNTRLENKNYNKKIWGNERQNQSGSRWLIANGMSKTSTSKHPMLKSKQMPAKTKVKQGDSLWSISAQVHGSGAKWPEIAALNPHIRNPNVIFANDIIRTR